MRYSKLGGQAVIEGVMMKHEKNIRLPSVSRMVELK